MREKQGNCTVVLTLRRAGAECKCVADYCHLNSSETLLNEQVVITMVIMQWDRYTSILSQIILIGLSFQEWEEMQLIDKELLVSVGY